MQRGERLLRKVTGRTGGDWKVARADRDDRHLRVLLAAVLSADSCCIDVGANQGAVLEEIVRLAPLGSHIAYEPLPHLAEDLGHRFPGVEVRRAALSNTDGPTTFNYVRNFPAYSGLRHRTYPGEPDIEVLEVMAERLDDHLPESFAPALIKIDVEGAERLVLEGAMETLRRHQPVVVLEDSGNMAPEYGSDSGQIFDLLVGQAGMRIFDMDGNGPYTRDEYATSSFWNFIARS
jgi:FkbM family methyltransferase